ncbi:MAG: restriction endonuclease [Lachnospiraceae bacterium]
MLRIIYYILMAAGVISLFVLGVIHNGSDFLILMGIILILHSLCRWLLNKFKLTPSGADRSIEQIDKMTGREFEEFVAAVLEGCGYEIDEITAASGDYGADIIAVADGERIAVQCKRYGKPVGVKAVQEVISAMKHYSCQRAAVITNSTFTNQAYTLAEDNEVVTLWDRESLLNMRNQSVRHKRNKQ